MAHDGPFPRYAADGESPRFRHRPPPSATRSLSRPSQWILNAFALRRSRHPTAGKPGIDTATLASGRCFPQSTSGGITPSEQECHDQARTGRSRNRPRTDVGAASQRRQPAVRQDPWGTRCQISENRVICDTCEPGLLLDTPAGAASCGRGTASDEIAVDAAGAQHPPDPGILGPSPDIQALADGQTYHVNGWTVVAGNWVRFTNDATGHGVAVAPQNNYPF
ncbi:MAG: hypothetical protein QOJ80_6078 [Mycobacterium sp.]|nr:hypothetical protein [Mycobacterium sp.]